MPSVDLSTTGREYWRSLDELAETEEFQHFLAHEFPNFEGNQDVLQSSSRRNFLKIMGASFALVGLTGCRRWPEQKLAPYASRPEGMMPGVPEKYASAWEFAGIAQPLLVTTVDGRPLKIDGHPDHPASLGKSSHWAQASILEMYDPDRSRTVMRRENGNRNPVTWERFDRETAGEFAALREADGRGFAILSEASSSPSLARLRRRFQQIYPNATWYEYEPVSRDAQISGAEIAFGQRLRTVLHLDQAAVIVSLDADLLGTDPDVLRNSRGWGRGRAAVDEGWMNRLYIAEPNFTVTGTVADGRLPAPPSRIAALAIAIHAGITGGSVSENVSLSPAEQAFVDDVVSDLQEVGSRGLLVAGPSQSAEVHALCHAVNARLNAIGTTVHFVEEPADSGSIAGIRELNDRIREGSIEALFMIGGNPVWDAPTDLSFGEAVAQVPVSMHLSIYDDETSQASTWHLPRAHYLEAWGDCRTMDGTISIAQPMIRPLYDGRSAIEMLARINNERPFDGADIVRTTLRPMLRNEAEFEKAWRVAVRNAGVPDSAWSRVTPRLRSNLPMPEVKARAATAEYEAVFVLDHSMYDGRFANNGWLQELPDPLTKITWDNAVLVSPSLARDRGIENEELIDITINGRTLQMAAFVVPGIAPGTLVIPLGYGRTAAGNVGTEVGFNTYQMRTTDALGFVVNAKISPTGRSYMLASTQNHHLIEEGLLENMYEDRKKDLVREADLETYLKKPDFPKKKKSLDLRL
ncbi:MAG: TAT-variant-translocated molybdopterin oxidoreductase, partial [Planctomycetota bacterium]